jgi:hypothetical protein
MISTFQSLGSKFAPQVVPKLRNNFGLTSLGIEVFAISLPLVAETVIKIKRTYIQDD